MRAWPARNTAAWPAELPPPTTTDVGSRAQLRLVGRRGVVDAAALEALAPFDFEPAVVGAGRDQQALGDERLAAVECEHAGSRRRTSRR